MAQKTTLGGRGGRSTICRMLLLEVSLYSLGLQYILLLLGLFSLGFSPEVIADGVKYRFLGIIGKNREEWAVADFACMRSNVTIVPFFESLGAEAIAYVLNQTELSTICCEKKSFATLLKLKKDGKIAGVKNLVCFDPVDETMAKSAAEVDLKSYNF